MSLKPDTPLVDRLYPSPNVEPRRITGPPTMLILHYTGLIDIDKAIDWLSRPESKVSCHYVITAEGEIVQMVAERERAWHAGLSSWLGETDVNSASIGIEIDNPGHEHGLPAFPPRQMQAVAALSRDIIRRNAIRPERVLAHSDVAPQRKIDPGERFDWAWLAGEGVGHWVAPPPVVSDGPPAEIDEPGIVALQRLLVRYGYDVRADGMLDPAARKVIAAFQRHFRPARVDGVADAGTLGALERLLAALEAGRTT